VVQLALLHLGLGPQSGRLGLCGQVQNCNESRGVESGEGMVELCQQNWDSFLGLIHSRHRPI